MLTPFYFVLQSELEKKAAKLFQDFRHVKTIARSEVTKKRKYGTVQEIDALFDYVSSNDDDGAHCFGSRKLAKKYPTKKVQPVFFKTLPDGDAPEYFQLVNNLTKIGLTMADFYRASASVKDQ
jgi:hypothetical protein